MKCIFCESSMETEYDDNSLDFHRYLEGMPIESRQYKVCPKCGAVYEGGEWSQPTDKVYVATQKQINLILHLLIKNSIVDELNYNAFNLVYRDFEYGDFSDKYIKISKKTADYYIKQLNKMGKGWITYLKGYVDRGITNEYFKSKFVIDQELLFDLLEDGVDF